MLAPPACCGVLYLPAWPWFVHTWALTTGHDNWARRRPVLFCCLGFGVGPIQGQKTTQRHTNRYAFWNMSVNVFNQFVAKCLWLSFEELVTILS